MRINTFILDIDIFLYMKGENTTKFVRQLRTIKWLISMTRYN